MYLKNYLYTIDLVQFSSVEFSLFSVSTWAIVFMFRLFWIEIKVAFYLIFDFCTI